MFSFLIISGGGLGFLFDVRWQTHTWLQTFVSITSELCVWDHSSNLCVSYSWLTIANLQKPRCARQQTCQDRHSPAVTQVRLEGRQVQRTKSLLFIRFMLTQESNKKMSMKTKAVGFGTNPVFGPELSAVQQKVILDREVRDAWKDGKWQVKKVQQNCVHAHTSTVKLLLPICADTRW